MSNALTDSSADEAFPWETTFSQQHGIDFEAPQQTHPDGKIFHVFRKANFSRLSLIDGLERPLDSWLTDQEHMINDMFYERIRPALVLATHFIENSRDFFDKIFNHELILKAGKYSIDHDFKTIPETEYFWNEVVMNNIRNFQIFIGWHEDHEKADVKHNHATLHYGQHPENAPEKIRTCALQLNSAFATFFMHPSFPQWPKEKIQRVLFILAATITHELVHLCYRFKWYYRLESGNRLPEEEPHFYDSDPTAELGLAWEREAFGGTPDLKYIDGYKPYTEGQALGIINMKHIPGWSGCHNHSILSVKAVDDKDIEAFFDSECWTIFTSIRSNQHPSVKAVVGDNFVETMKVALFIKGYKLIHGKYPSVEEIEKPVLRDDIWDNKGGRSAIDASDLTATSAPVAAAPVVRAQQASMPTTPASAAPATYENEWLALGSSASYQQAKQNEGARRR